MTFTHGVLTSGEFATYPIEALDAALDSAWATRSAATEQACQILAARILGTVSRHVPDAASVVLREDSSHLPAHGHVDAIVDRHGMNLLDILNLNWHDLSWCAEIDEDVWDLYHLAPHLFAASDDGIRRLVLSGGDVNAPSVESPLLP